jgi:hypothetical protein
MIMRLESKHRPINARAIIYREPEFDRQSILAAGQKVKAHDISPEGTRFIGGTRANEYRQESNCCLRS